MEMNYLTEEEQFKEVLNNEEIKRIKDPVLREIRSKYWSLQAKCFLDEHGIKDTEIGEVSRKLRQEEFEEIEKYKIKNGYKTTV